MKEFKHNFKKLEYSFATINGEEFGKCILSENGCSVGGISYGPMIGSNTQMLEQSRANARRITACVNYCENISTEDLENSLKIAEVEGNRMKEFDHKFVASVVCNKPYTKERLVQFLSDCKSNELEYRRMSSQVVDIKNLLRLAEQEIRLLKSLVLTLENQTGRE